MRRSDRGDEVDEAAVERAASSLDAGQVVAVPTDTVYGLAAALGRPGAAQALFEMKGRPSGLALPVLVSGVGDLAGLVGDWPAAAAGLAARFWPGPLTLVVPAAPGVGAVVGGDGMTVGVRAPANPSVAALVARVGPLVTTSANRHGEPPCTTADAVRAAFTGRAGPAYVLDGGTCDSAPSTVVDTTVVPPRVVREGPIPAAEIAEAPRGASGPQRGSTPG